MKKLIIANWKMNPKKPREALSLAREVGRGIKNVRNVEVVLAPPFIFLPLLSKTTNHKLKTINYKLGAQDVFYGNGGAYTGEISPLQLKSLGVGLVIVGHSERRELGETNEIVRRKLKAALEADLRAVLCVGEKEKERDVVFPKIIRDELREGLRKIPKQLLRNLIVAYEPVWAIGKDEADTPKDVYGLAILIRRELYGLLGRSTASRIRILYGGSVDQKNSAVFVRDSRVDGLLVGGAGLNPKKFVNIVRGAAASK